MILNSDSGSGYQVQGVKEKAYRVTGSQGGKHTWSKGDKRGGHTGSRGSMDRPTGSQGVKGWAYRVSGGQGVGLQGPMGSRGRPKGSQGVKG